MGLFQIRQGQKSVVVGDVGDPAIVATLHSACQSPALVSGGFSCQPWSALGDKRKSGDPRSGSLVKLLRLAFWLRAHSVILECVSEAGEDQEVQNIIARFCKLTGFNQPQAVLHLESIVPARRTRWWCMLSNASVPGFCICPLPKMHPAPNVGDIFPTFPQWDPQDLTQLELDHYETNKFMEFVGLFDGWANQLTGCPCLCRQYPFSEERLKSKGIFGALIQLGGEFETYQGKLPKTRHMHPWEMALLHGASPNRPWKPNLRFNIAAFGQMAAPIQSAWVVAQFQVHRAQAEGLQVIAEEILWNHFATVFRDAAFSRPDIMATNACQNFTNRVYSCLLASAAARSGLQKSISVDEKQERENSQRKGRENLPRTAPIGAHKQPADQSQELRRNGENQPATRTQEPGPPMVLQPMPSDHPKVIGPSPLEKGPSRKPCSPSSVDKDGVVVDHLDKQPTTRTSEPGPPMCLQAMPSDHPKVIGPSPRENSPGPLLCFPGSVSNLQVGLENEKGGELLVAKQMHRELFQKQSKQKGAHSSRDDAGKIHEPNGTKAKHWSDPGSSSTCVGGGMQLLPQELPLAHRSLCQVSPGR